MGRAPEGTRAELEWRIQMRKNKAVKYSIWSNSCYMVKLAAKKVPSVICLMLLQALLVVAAALLELYVVPVILGSLEEHVSIGDLLGKIFIFTAAMMGTSGLSAYISQNLMFGRTRVRASLTLEVEKKGETCSYPLTERQDFINLKAKANEALFSNTAPAEEVWNTFAGIIQNVLGFLIYLYLLTNVGLLVVSVTSVTAVGDYLVRWRLNGWGYRHRQEESKISQGIQYIQGRTRDRYLAKDIRIFGMEEWLKGLHERYLKMYQDFGAKREKVYFLADLAHILLYFLRNGAAYGWLLYLALEGKLTAPEFLLQFTAVGGFTAWIGGIMDSFSELHRQSLALSSVREFLDYEELFRMEGGEAIAVEKTKAYTIELRDVSFRYKETGKEIFSHLNMMIHPGEKLAVVGLNGAGKTTLIKLICGFYDPDSGEVLLNGVNIKKYNRRDYYQLFSGVFQDFCLLPSDVAVNVAQKINDIDMERVLACIEKAGLKKKIESLPQKYHTQLVKEVYEDGADLSGGEMQLLLLARLIYKDSPVVVLDEPTAALDAIAESNIYQSYHELTEGKSAVFISHRLASTRFCTRILLIEDGRITEQGTHDELLKKGGSYAKLFDLQSKYYREGEQKNGRQS